MKIAFINGNPFWGGAEKWHVAAARYLKAKGHDVSFFASSEEVASQVREAGAPVEILGFKSDIDPITFYRLYVGLSEEKPDCVLLNSERDVRLGGSAARLAGVKTIIHRKGISGVKNNPRYRWTYRNLKTHTLCVAEAVKREIVALDWVPEETLKVIYSGVDLEKFKPDGSRNLRSKIARSDEDILIGAVARMSSIKGFEYLIDAMPQILSSKPQVKLVFVGTGRIEDELKARAEKLAVSAAVFFTGFTMDSPDAIRSLDIVVHPSVHTEGLPNGVLEAMACGVPVIGTPIAGIPEAIVHDETGLIVPSRDSAAIAAAVVRVASDISLRKRFSDAARHRAGAMFEVNARLSELEGWLKTLVSGK